MAYSFAMRKLLAVTVVAVLTVGGISASAGRPPVKNVVVITLDGMRWQELFGGVERSLLGKDEKETTASSSFKRFWRETPEERRTALFACSAAGRFVSVLARRNHTTEMTATITTSRAIAIQSGARDPLSGSDSSGGADSDPRRKSSSGSMVYSRLPRY